MKTKKYTEQDLFKVIEKTIPCIHRQARVFVQSVRELHREWFENDDELLSQSDEDLSMLEKFNKHMKKKQYKSASKLFNSMDTAVQDLVTDSYWDLLEQNT
tara:strand:+ start:745 stop:1047 length:303 start_codon:yes stop_codon:yes gene_type:complete